MKGEQKFVCDILITMLKVILQNWRTDFYDLGNLSFHTGKMKTVNF